MRTFDDWWEKVRPKDNSDFGKNIVETQRLAAKAGWRAALDSVRENLIMKEDDDERS